LVRVYGKRVQSPRCRATVSDVVMSFGHCENGKAARGYRVASQETGVNLLINPFRVQRRIAPCAVFSFFTFFF